MKTLILYFILLCTPLLAQEPIINPIIPEEIPTVPEPNSSRFQVDEICDFADKEAEFPGGNDSLLIYLKKNMKYPLSGEDCVQGVVYAGFVVEPDGSVSDIKILRGIAKELDREAIRLIRAMPNWIPGECKEGKPGRTRKIIPVKFVLD